jgi:4,5-dihydroxyphthalate decarboxylase
VAVSATVYHSPAKRYAIAWRRCTMANLELSFAMTAYDRVRPMLDGEVKVDGIDLDYKGMPGAVPRVFYEQIKFNRYDISEMSMSSYLRMRPEGFPYRMLPVFHNRQFSYTTINIRRSSGIRQDHPEDLRGKRIGIMDYQQSIGLWTRGILKMEWGIGAEEMIWYQERGEHLSHTGASAGSGLGLPEKLELRHAGTDFGSMYLDGALDASIGAIAGNRVSGIDRKRVDLTGNPEFPGLFSDPRAESVRLMAKHGVYPPHHVTVIRESILEEHPWVALSLMDAFERSKEIAIDRVHHQPPTLMVFGGQYLEELDAVFGRDPFPYGIKANAKAFDMAQTFSFEQGLSMRKQPLDEIFPEEIIYSEERLPDPMP